MIVHQIEALRDAGVTEVVLAINYQPQVMYSFIEEYQAKLGVKITISQARGAGLRAGGACAVVCVWSARASRAFSEGRGCARVRVARAWRRARTAAAHARLRAPRTRVHAAPARCAAPRRPPAHRSVLTRALSTHASLRLSPRFVAVAGD
jgi:hypothetical protein